MPIKIGIITLSGYDNYGNRLQNLALQTALEKLGCEVKTLWVNSLCQEEATKPHCFKLSISYIKHMLAKKVVMHRKKNRRHRFKQFNKKYIKVYNRFVSKDKMDAIVISEFDYFIVGSDQVWNYKFDDVGKTFFLKDVPKEKSIGYAISIGQDIIPDKLISLYKNAVDNFKSISVREKQAAELLYKISRRHIPVLCDPVMLLDKQEWIKFGNPTKLNKQKYVLVNILSQEKKQIQKSIEIAKALMLRIIIIGNPKYKKGYETDPGDFITYIDNAALVITDSFHAVSFSIIMSTPFLAIKRGEAMDCRLTDLLETMGLEKRYLDIEQECNYLNMVFTNAHSIIKKKRKEAIDFLKDSIDNGTK